MDSKTTVSIVVAYFNQTSTVEKTIKASLGQDYPDDKLEVILVDDGSSDNIRERISKYPVKYIYQNHRGASAARNRGIKEAEGDIVFFTDADCIPPKDWVRKMAAHFILLDSKPRKTFGLLRGKHLTGFTFDNSIAACGGSYGIANCDNFISNCIYQEIIYRHSKMPKCPKALGSFNLAVRKNILLEIGGFDENFITSSGEDNDLCYRLIKRGYVLVFDKDIKVLHFHPQKLFYYLKRQFQHGMWRVKLYKKHPKMVKGDDYSNIFDFIQPILAILLISLSFLYPIGEIYKLWWLILFIYTGLQLYLPLKIVYKTKKLNYLYLAYITFWRGFVRGLGMFFGIWYFIIRGK